MTGYCPWCGGTPPTTGDPAADALDLRDHIEECREGHA